MKPRYAVINEYERDQFEKEWQLPYGYAKCFVSLNPQEAIDVLEKFLNSHDINSTVWIVEKISDEGREFYYRI